VHLYFIRHAQSENNLLWAQTGSFEGRDEDPNITPVGRQQAQALARFLREQGEQDGGLEALMMDYNPQDVRGFGLTHLYCSLMIRAIETGRVVARALNLPLVAWPGVHETGGIHLRDPGTGEHLGLPGRGRSFFEAHYPELELPDSVGEEGWWNRPFEEYEQRRGRAQRFLDELAERHGGTEDRVAVISHGGFYNHVMRCLLRMPEDYGRWFSMNNTAITRIDFDVDTTWIHYTNRCDFLPAELIT
jgi:2,3-bisphosphoglycerate-dependent phosphoglycerate mutase